MDGSGVGLHQATSLAELRHQLLSIMSCKLLVTCPAPSAVLPTPATLPGAELPALAAPSPSGASTPAQRQTSPQGAAVKRKSGPVLMQVRTEVVVWLQKHRCSQKASPTAVNTFCASELLSCTAHAALGVCQQPSSVLLHVTLP